MTIEVVRTDEDRFIDLPDWPYQPHYVQDLSGYEGLRMHHVDEGPKNVDVFLCLHGEPTWAYLFRRMIPSFLESGARVVAPDFFGFGRSDKPVDDDVYTWDFQRGSLTAFIKRLDLTNITLVVQDWGGLLGLSLGADMADRISGLLIMNTAFAIGGQPTQGFLDWRDFVARTPDLDVGRLMKQTCPHLSDDEVRAYDAPFPNESFKAGAREFPVLVPITPTNPASAANRRAWEILKTWEKPVLTAFSDLDQITRIYEVPIQTLIPGAEGQPHTVIRNANHFLQEDAGEELAELVIQFIRETPQ